VQKSGTLRFLADDFFAEVGVEIWLSKNLGQATIVGDQGVGSEEFFWPGGGGRLKKVPDTFFLTFFLPWRRIMVRYAVAARTLWTAPVYSLLPFTFRFRFNRWY